MNNKNSNFTICSNDTGLDLTEQEQSTLLNTCEPLYCKNRTAYDSYVWEQLTPKTNNQMIRYHYQTIATYDNLNGFYEFEGLKCKLIDQVPLISKLFLEILKSGIFFTIIDKILNNKMCVSASIFHEKINIEHIIALKDSINCNFNNFDDEKKLLLLNTFFRMCDVYDLLKCTECNWTREERCECNFATFNKKFLKLYAHILNKHNKTFKTFKLIEKDL